MKILIFVLILASFSFLAVAGNSSQFELECRYDSSKGRKGNLFVKADTQSSQVHIKYRRYKLSPTKCIVKKGVIESMIECTDRNNSVGIILRRKTQTNLQGMAVFEKRKFLAELNCTLKQ